MDVDDPTVQRRRLRVELRGLRTDAGLTQREVAAAMDWSPSKLLRIEKGTVAISTTDLKALLAHYGVVEQAKVDELVQLGQASRRQTITLNTYHDILAPGFVTYLNEEGAASVIRQFQPTLVPGLLQTEEYARAVIRGLSAPTTEEVIERRVSARMERQQLLDRTDPPQMIFVLDEAILRRRVGGPGVMRRQLEEIRKAAERPKTTVRIMPFSKGVYTGMLGPFVVLEFPDPAVDDLLYIEDYKGDVVLRDQSAEVSSSLETFWRLEDWASSPEDLDTYIDAAIAEIGESTRVGV